MSTAREFGLLSPSGRIWALDPADGAGAPTTMADAVKIAGDFGWILLERVDGEWVPVEEAGE